MGKKNKNKPQEEGKPQQKESQSSQQQQQSQSSQQQQSQPSQQRQQQPPGPQQQQQQQKGPQKQKGGQQQQKEPQQQQQPKGPQQQQQQKGPQQQQKGPQQQQKGPQQQQQQKGPQQQQQQKGPQPQQRKGPQQQQQQSQQKVTEPQFAPPQKSAPPLQWVAQPSGPPQQSQQWGPQQSVLPSPSGFVQSVLPSPSGFIQSGPPQQWGTQQSGPQQQPQQWGPQQSGPQQQQQRGPQQSVLPSPSGFVQSGPQQQPQQRGPQQSGPQQQTQQWGPQQQQQRGPQPSGPPQQSQQWGPQQSGPQQQRGPQQSGQQQQAQQRGPQQSGQQQQAQQRGSQQSGQQQQAQQRLPQQSAQPQQRAPQQSAPQRQQQPQTGDRPAQKQAGPQESPKQLSEERSSQDSQQSVPKKGYTKYESAYAPVSNGKIRRGTRGKRDRVEANYLEFDLQKMPSEAYHYDVTITPDRPKKFLRPAFELFNKKFFPNIAMAYDGQKSFYTIQKLKDHKFEGEIEYQEDERRKITFKVAVQETGDSRIDLNSLKSYFNDRIFDKPMRALQCLEVVLATPCHSIGKRVGRSFFLQPDRLYDLKEGYEMWTGLYQAAILGDRPFLNVDISHKSFPRSTTLLEYLANNFRDFNPSRPLVGYSLTNLKTFLKGMNLQYTPPKVFNSFAKLYKVNEVLSDSANSKTFKLDDGTKQTVAEYFRQKGYKLQYPELNLIHLGSSLKQIYIPIELCSIPAGQALNKKDGSRQVQEMIRFAATSTNERKDKIMRLLNAFNHNTNSVICNFGIQIGRSFIDVPIRILNAPQIVYNMGQKVLPRNGAWRVDSQKFLETKPAASNNWAILYSKRGRTNYNTIMEFVRLMNNGARQRSVSLAEKTFIDGFDNIDTKLADLKSKGPFVLIVVVIPGGGTSYADIKQAAELKYGVLTQCIKEETINRRLNDMLIQNLLLKINAKLNGTNHKINEIPQQPLKNVMFLGADVTHPSPDQRDIPSVVGVAASHDQNGFCYNMQYRLQRPTLEDIEDMEHIITHHLKVYKTHQKRYPDHIIYYRDGVSDGQFPIVKNSELRNIRVACKKLGINVKLTCVIVVKRHHTRLFPKTVGRDKFNNVSPGTVVDEVIVHPNEVQFFMVSHQSIQGTAKPTRYNVIEDDAKIDIDLLQEMTFYLCHMFPRCNRSVSYPAPAYLAHLVAFRGRAYIEGARSLDNSALRREYERRLIKPEFLASNPMYFV